MYDLVIIGGGINGAGIARDAAGRGLSVLLVEQDDLAQATSSASTKLIHGGLRYLEQYDFKLVRESLNERERLLRSAPHLIRPQEFVIPHEPSLRPRWMIRLGLWLYDCLGKRDVLPASQAFSLVQHLAGVPLKSHYHYGFSYADCWVDDARLVLLCAKDAAEKGAEIRTRTRCETLSARDKHWNVTLYDALKGEPYQVQARCVVNAAGPWVRRFLDDQGLAQPETYHMRHSKGSHIVVKKLYEGDHAYLLQQLDKRIVFAIPYEHDFTVIGTTDTPYDGALDHVVIDDQEIDYLCTAVSRSFANTVRASDVLWTYSGVRGLLDSGNDNLSEVTRDYKLDMENRFGAPLLNVFGGKLTTFRELSEQACTILCDTLGHHAKAWTENSILPGGDIGSLDFDAFVARQAPRYSFLSDQVLRRYAHAYGTRMDVMLDGVDSLDGMGEDFGEDVYEVELRYGIMQEWVHSAEDFLWRRSKLGLHTSEETQRKIARALAVYLMGAIA